MLFMVAYYVKKTTMTCLSILAIFDAIIALSTGKEW